MPTWFTCMQNLNYEFKTFYVLACFLLHGTICLSSNIQLVTQAQLLTGVSIQQQRSDRPTPVGARAYTHVRQCQGRQAVQDTMASSICSS